MDHGSKGQIALWITDPRWNVVCNNTDKGKTYTVTEIDLSKAPANKGGHIVDRRPYIYKL